MQGSLENQPYSYVRNTWSYVYPLLAQPGTVMAGTPPYTNIVINQILYDQVSKCSYFIYTSGPDLFDGTFRGKAPVIYDPTNGTTSYGDIHRFGSGSPDTDQDAGNM